MRVNASSASTRVEMSRIQFLRQKICQSIAIGASVGGTKLNWRWQRQECSQRSPQHFWSKNYVLIDATIEVDLGNGATMLGAQNDTQDFGWGLVMADSRPTVANFWQLSAFTFHLCAATFYSTGRLRHQETFPFRSPNHALKTLLWL